MFFSNNNKKLGKGVVSVSRPIGDSCPITCPLHPQAEGPNRNRCYMVRLEGMYPNVRKAAFRNMEADAEELAQMLAGALADGHLVRLHVGGDFQGPTGRLDYSYLAEWIKALFLVGDERPPILAFTHCLDSILPGVIKPFRETFKLFASVHGKEDLKKARAEGFDLFALTMPDHIATWPKNQAWIERHGERWLVCPEQRGKLPDCDSCRYCWMGRGNVAFLDHTYMSHKGVRSNIKKPPHLEKVAISGG